ncbi:hypothetical protein [Yoonia sp. BS5-3]|uniref:Uncharacterized protein n=1 Tax=Yoonia phaeophyticola TaxID=3137369 RepID=A0ABZ2V1S6_9RHOB
MRNFLKKIIGIALVLGGIQLVGMWYFGKVHAELAEEYALSEDGLEYAISCENRLNWHDQEFTSGRDTLDGCGCIARNVQAEYPDDMVAGQTVVRDMINWLSEDEPTEPDWAALASEAGIDEALYEGLLFAGLSGLQACNVSESA